MATQTITFDTENPAEIAAAITQLAQLLAGLKGGGQANLAWQPVDWHRFRADSAFDRKHAITRALQLQHPGAVTNGMLAAIRELRRNGKLVYACYWEGQELWLKGYARPTHQWVAAYLRNIGMAS